MAIAVSLDILRGYNDRINCGPNALQIPIDAAHEFKGIPTVPDDEQVDIVGNVETIPGSGPEQDDLLGLDCINDTLDYIVQGLLVDHWSGLWD